MFVLVKGFPKLNTILSKLYPLNGPNARLVALFVWFFLVDCCSDREFYTPYGGVIYAEEWYFIPNAQYSPPLRSEESMCTSAEKKTNLISLSSETYTSILSSVHWFTTVDLTRNLFFHR